MIFRAWDEPNRFTDIDAGITAADTLDETVEHSVKLDVREVPSGWLWEVYTVDGPDADGEVDEWEVDKGFAATREQAEAAGEAAKETHRLSLIRG